MLWIGEAIGVPEFGCRAFNEVAMITVVKRQGVRVLTASRPSVMPSAV